MKDRESSREDGHIGGVSLSSFLQMLEQERKSCTLVVTSGTRKGHFYFNNGSLVDARFEAQIGQDAAFSILLWESPTFSVTPPEDRMQRIYLPLAHILLDSAKRQDEQDGDPDQDGHYGEAYDDSADEPVEPDHPDPAVRRIIRKIVSVSDIRHYFLLNRQGKLITQSSRRMKIADFIAYCIVSGIQMRKVLDVKGPNRIQLVLDSGETIMIMPGEGMIIGILLDEFASVSEVSDQLADITAGR